MSDETDPETNVSENVAVSNEGIDEIKADVMNTADNDDNDDNDANVDDVVNQSTTKEEEGDECPEIIVEEEIDSVEKDNEEDEDSTSIGTVPGTDGDNLDSNDGEKPDVDAKSNEAVHESKKEEIAMDEISQNSSVEERADDETNEIEEIDSKPDIVERKTDEDSAEKEDEKTPQPNGNVDKDCVIDANLALGVTPQKSNKMRDNVYIPIKNNNNNSNNNNSNKSSGNNDERKLPPQSNTISSSSSSSPPSLSPSSSNSKQTPNNLFNKFASWKSKADAVIQNSEVLKAAQKSIEEKTKEVQMAVKVNLNNSAKSQHRKSTTMKNNQLKKQQKTISHDILETIPSGVDVENETQRLNSDENRRINSDVEITSDDENNAAVLLNTYIENDDQSKQSRLTLEEDDFSYDSRDVSRNGDSESEQSSVFVDNDDAFSNSTYSSDQSSVRIRSPPRRRHNRLALSSANRHLGSSSTALSSSPTKSSSAKPSPKSSALSSFTGSGPGSNAQNDGDPVVPRQLFNFEDVAKKRSGTTNTATATNRTEEVSNSVTKGRYAQTISRPAILQHLQRKVRVPSPPPLPESSSSSSIVTSNAKHSGSVEEAMDKQMTRIRRFVGSQVMEVMLSQLSSGEYLMFLGPGMLGVNLKQTFLKKHGVYVDFVVPGGNAHKSEVIWIGDRLMKVGNTDVSKGTIYDVPGIIANMKRPIILILNGEHDVEWEKMDNLAVAIAMINKIQHQSKKDFNYSSMINIEQKPVGKSVIPPSPSKLVRKSLQSFVRKRCNEINSFSSLAYACKCDEGLQRVLSEAFMTCCIDNRRLPFLAAFISNEDSYLGYGEDESQLNRGSISGSIRLMLLLELISFRDLFGVTPTHRRLEAAKRIAHKFFLPQVTESNKNPTINPQFDVRPLIPQDVIAAIESRLEKQETSYNMYGDVERILRDSFGGMKFVSFLLSDECARMRAYMRGTSPYLDPDLKCLFEASQNPTSKNYVPARNHLEFMMIYLLCQSQSDVFDKNYTTRDFGANRNDRVMGATGGICCAIFIEKVLIPSINNAKTALLKNQMNEIDAMGQTLIESYSQFWECFIAPSGGTLASTPLSNDTQAILDKVRRSVSLAASPPKNFTHQERRRHFIQSLSLNIDLAKSLQRLKEELIYDYSVNGHPKYRGHTIHEWMCGEVNKAAYKPFDQPDTSEAFEDPEIPEIPPLPSGSITRLFRRLEFPEGLSRHCPELNTSIDPKEEQYEGDKRENADYVIVFGSDQSTSADNRNGELPNEISLQPPTLRRFICQPVSTEGERNLGTGNLEELIPSTLESYAHVPMLGDRQFQHISDESRVTMDGWEVSLINFILPCNKTDASVGDGFLYGVSLVFNLKAGTEVSEQVSIEIINDENQRVTWSKLNDKPKLTIYVDSNDIDKVNQTLSQKSLSERIQNQDVTSGESSFSIGVALVSHKNVIMAMRKSLSRFFEDLTGMGSPTPVRAIASPIVKILETCRTEGANEISVLPPILRPYLDFGHSCISKITSPTLNQKSLFENSAIDALVESIPPIPLALLLITALLEQKIIFTSRRRSNLISMTVALKSLLSPFDWSHLFVPIVPSGLASDLLQYPAPFILGIPFSVGSMALLKSVPDDVTIVDVDVGRVILAKTFSVHFIEQAESIDQKNTSTAALRSQVLHLAETIGGVIGSKSSKALWNCDSPIIDMPLLGDHHEKTKGEAVSVVFKSFLKELLVGCNTCCFWVEEPILSDTQEGRETGSECNILFDEDRFYHIKRLRTEGNYKPLFTDEDYHLSSPASNDDKNYKELSKLGTDSSYSLNLDHFNLIIDTFLRGQLLSLYLSSKLDRESMSFW